MSYFVNTTLREAKRMTALQETYEKQLADLPKGSIRVKERNEKKYYYLAYAIKRLKVEALFNQILFHTEKSLTYCRFAKFEKLENIK